MGTIYSVACKTCKITRDLDKFYNSGDYVDTRADAIVHAGDVERKSFRPALLVSFMAKHMGHECIFFNEHSDCLEEYDPFFEKNGFKEDVNFFDDSEHPK